MRYAVIIPCDGKTVEDVEKASLVGQTSWGAFLRDHVPRFLSLGEQEELIGIIVSDDGITFKFRYK